MIACGLDFGTSNSAIGVLRGNAPALAPIEGESTLMPSAVFFDDWTGPGALRQPMPSPPISARPKAG